MNRPLRIVSLIAVSAVPFTPRVLDRQNRLDSFMNASHAGHHASMLTRIRTWFGIGPHR